MFMHIFNSPNYTSSELYRNRDIIRTDREHMEPETRNKDRDVASIFGMYHIFRKRRKMYSGLVSVSYIMEGYSCLEQFHGFVN
jgi:hypothetical protein